MGLYTYVSAFDKTVYKYTVVKYESWDKLIMVERIDGKQFVRKIDPKSEYDYIITNYDADEDYREPVEEDKYRKYYDNVDVEVIEMSNKQYYKDINDENSKIGRRLFQNKEYGDVKNNDVFLVVEYH